MSFGGNILGRLLGFTGLLCLLGFAPELSSAAATPDLTAAVAPRCSAAAAPTPSQSAVQATPEANLQEELAETVPEPEQELEELCSAALRLATARPGPSADARPPERRDDHGNAFRLHAFAARAPPRA